MKKTLKTIMIAAAALLALASPASAIDYTKLGRFDMSFSVDEDGKTSPEVKIPIYWTDNLYSAFGYRDSNASETDTVEGFADSRESTTLSEQRIKLNILSYQSDPGAFRYSVGGEVENIGIDKQQFGYALVQGTYIAFDNDIEINATRANLLADMTLAFGKNANKQDIVNLRLGARVSPYTKLSVTQETALKPLIGGTGTESGSKTQELSYEVNFDGLLRTGTFVDLGLMASYEYLPMKYDLAVADYNNTTNTYYYASQEQKIEETTMRLAGRLIFDYKIMGEARPALGFGYEVVRTRDKSEGDGGSDTEKNQFIILAFENRF